MDHLVNRQSMHLVVYDCGLKFDRAKFQPIKNRDFVKPEGGLWASPIDARHGWREWSKAESYSPLETSFELKIRGRTLVINSRDDLVCLPWVSLSGFEAIKFPDFEAILASGVDAIHLTEQGERETRFSQPENLYGWDCECVLIMNPNIIAGESEDVGENSATF